MVSDAAGVLFRVIAIAKLASTRRRASQTSEAPFAISQRPVAPFHAFEVLAGECILYRLQRDPVSLRRFEILFWDVLERVCLGAPPHQRVALVYYNGWPVVKGQSGPRRHHGRATISLRMAKPFAAASSFLISLQRCCQLELKAFPNIGRR